MSDSIYKWADRTLDGEPIGANFLPLDHRHLSAIAVMAQRRIDRMINPDDGDAVLVRADALTTA